MSTPEIRWRDWLLAAAVSGALVVVVWWEIVCGGGLVGGDIYPYFFPQKQIVAESFADGSIPLWHHRTGLGYPLHAESQAGVYYPTTQVLYRVTDIHTAFHVNILLHYWLAGIFTWRLLRCFAGNAAGAFAMIVFVYGWFPARVSLEWSIIGGVYLPLVLWQVEEYSRRPSVRRLVVLGICLALHLLAGHFALAFICQLTALLYGGIRGIQTGRVDADRPEQRAWLRNASAVSLAIALGLLLAAVQLLPTYELKRTSQRQPEGESSKVFDPAYGHMPPGYLTQVVSSWWGWHSPESVANGDIHSAFGAVDADTNKVEAHLYWGLIPLALMLLWMVPKIRRDMNCTAIGWLVLMGLAVAYATGWFMPITRHLPGFNFFMGPGRYLMVASLAGAVLSSLVLNHLLRKQSVIVTGVVTVTLGGITLLDLLKSSEYVADALVVQNPPLLATEESWVRKALKPDNGFEKRVLAPGANILNLFETSSLPVYLGIGPSVYYTKATRPEIPEQLTSASVEALQDLGITHLLTQKPLTDFEDHFLEVGGYPDSLIQRIWGTGDPVYLYELKSPGNRVICSRGELESIRLLHRDGVSVEFELTASEATTVGLRELSYPGWTVTVNGEAYESLDFDDAYRWVDVPAGTSNVRWEYKPRSFQIGVWVSLLMLAVAVLLILKPERSKA